MSSRTFKSEPIEYCRVQSCRFKGTHIWRDHICGTCGQKGHGQMECGFNDLIQYLRINGKNDKLKKELYCRSINCPTKEYHTSSSHRCEICIKKGLSGKEIYHTVQECPYKEPPKDNFSHKIECPLCRTENKINGNSLEKLFGIESKCQICVTNDVNFLLPECKHCIMCIDCAKQIMVVNNNSNIDLSGAYDYWSDSYALNKMGDNPGKIYIKKYGGMGSTIYIKRDDVGQPLQQFMMHQDSWGQYGPETSEVPQLEAFLEGYNEIISD